RHAIDGEVDRIMQAILLHDREQFVIEVKRVQAAAQVIGEEIGAQAVLGAHPRTGERGELTELLLELRAAPLATGLRPIGPAIVAASVVLVASGVGREYRPLSKPLLVDLIEKSADGGRSILR